MYPRLQSVVWNMELVGIKSMDQQLDSTLIIDKKIVETVLCW